MIGGGGNGDHPSFGILTAASEALKSIGFDLTINDLADGTIMWDALNSETAEMWCAAWQATLDPDMVPDLPQRKAAAQTTTAICG